MKKLLEKIKKYFTKLKELNSDEQALIKHQSQCHFPGCTDFGVFIYICRYGQPCFCDYHKRENSPWTRAYLEKREWRHKTIARPNPLQLL